MNMQEIGFKISALRKQRDMTQLELADKMGVSYQAVSSWERGSTMPDISRLPDISKALEVSIDELLGNGPQAEIVKNVLTQQTDAYTQDNMPLIQDLAEIAPILKPSQVEHIMKKADPTKLSIGQLTGFAPFLSKEVLGQLAMSAEESGDIGSLCGLAPFLDEDTLDQLARRIDQVEGIAALTALAPFISKETLGELAIKAADAGDIHELYGLAPFIDSNILGQLVLKASSEN